MTFRHSLDSRICATRLRGQADMSWLGLLLFFLTTSARSKYSVTICPLVCGVKL